MTSPVTKSVRRIMTRNTHMATQRCGRIPESGPTHIFKRTRNEQMRKILRRYGLLAVFSVAAVSMVLPASAGSTTLYAGGCVGPAGTTLAQPTGMAYTHNSCPNGWRWINAIFYDEFGGILDSFNSGWTQYDLTFFGSSTSTDRISAGHSICPVAGTPCDLGFTQA